MVKLMCVKNTRMGISTLNLSFYDIRYFTSGKATY